MTRISEIHGIRRIPGNELPDRGRFAAPAQVGYLPYTAMSKGEFRLALLERQARLYAAAYPEVPELKKAAQMIDTALKGGVHNGVNFIGAMYEPMLQNIAAEIVTAAADTAPAAVNGYVGRGSLRAGIGEIRFAEERDCVQYATRVTNAQYGGDVKWWQYESNNPLQYVFGKKRKEFYLKAKSECQLRLDLERIANERMATASHHLLYKSLESGYALSNSTNTKRILHIAGIGGLANALDLDAKLLDTWTETSILERNAAVGVGVASSVRSSLYLAPDPDAAIAQYVEYLKKRGIIPADRPNATITGYRMNGLTLAAITALVTAIGAAIASAAQYQKELNAKKNNALAGVQGYGTAAFAAEQSDWNQPAGSFGSNNNLLWIGAAAAAGLYLINK